MNPLAEFSTDSLVAEIASRYQTAIVIATGPHDHTASVVSHARGEPHMLLAELAIMQHQSAAQVVDLIKSQTATSIKMQP